MPVSCDDGDACTTDSCDAVAGCSSIAKAEGAACHDGDACTTGETCTTGVCAGGAIVDCDDGNACSVAACDPATGCVYTGVAEGTACDDGTGCTLAQCTATATKSALTCAELYWYAPSGASPFVCGQDYFAFSGLSDDVYGSHAEADAFCSSGGARLCTIGEMRDGETSAIFGSNTQLNWSSSPCDAAGTSFWAAKPDPTHDPQTVECLPATETVRVTCCGDSAQAPQVPTCVAIEADCGSETCGAATCEAGSGCTVAAEPDPTCDDGLPCTIDSCVPYYGCVHQPDDSQCGDGTTCTVEVCDTTLGCQAEPVVCDDGVDCTADSCDPTLGCMHTPTDSACDDGVECTTGTCDATGGCTYAVDAPGTACEAAGSCSFGACGTPEVSAGDCASLGLDPLDGKNDDICGFHLSELSTESCFGSRPAAEAACSAFGARLCRLDELLLVEGNTTYFGQDLEGSLCGSADNFFWTADACGTDESWVIDYNEFLARCERHSDPQGGIACCVDADPVVAATETACVSTEATCVSATCGQTFCDFTDDGNCGFFDEFASCDDGDACTVDSCSATSGCSNAPTSAACGGCTQDSECDDGVPCTVDTCSSVGCLHAPNDAVCDADGNSCSTEYCHPTNGCAQAFERQGTPCETGDACTVGSCRTRKATASSMDCDALGWVASDVGGEYVCGASEVGASGACSGTLVHETASGFCAAAGARLCTLSELLADETALTGCAYDDARVWSSTQCGPNSVWTAPGMVQNLGTVPVECTQRSSHSAVARCCADTLTGPARVCIAEEAPSDDGLTCTGETGDPATGAITPTVDLSCAVSGECCLEADAPELCAQGRYADGRCYVAQVSVAFVTWAQAQVQCEASGGTLATLLSASGNAIALAETEATCGPLSAFIGLTDEVEEGVFHWASGHTVDWQNWDSDYPKNTQNADHVTLDSSGTWRDRASYYKINCFLCEVPPVADSGVCFASSSCP